MLAAASVAMVFVLVTFVLVFLAIMVVKRMFPKDQKDNK
jgi:predicted permease